MTRIATLPEDMKGPPAKPKMVVPGEYSVLVKTMNESFPNRFWVTYEVLDTGDFEGEEIPDKFDLKYDRAQEMMSEFLDVIGVHRDGRSFDLDSCVGKKLCVTVRHKDGWVNVVSHRPDF